VRGLRLLQDARHPGNLPTAGIEATDRVTLFTV